jgi:hypothetical protein
VGVSVLTLCKGNHQGWLFYRFFLFNMSDGDFFPLSVRLSDTQKALQTVVAGQQAENLLDFDDGPTAEGQPSGLAATEVLSSTPAAANLLAGTSTNPLDDLVSIFGNVGGQNQNNLGGLSFGGGGGGGGFGVPVMPAPQMSSPTVTPAAVSPVQRPQEDLLGLF